MSPEFGYLVRNCNEKENVVCRLVNTLGKLKWNS